MAAVDLSTVEKLRAFLATPPSEKLLKYLQEHPANAKDDSRVSIGALLAHLEDREAFIVTLVARIDLLEKQVGEHTKALQIVGKAMFQPSTETSTEAGTPADAVAAATEDATPTADTTTEDGRPRDATPFPAGVSVRGAGPGGGRVSTPAPTPAAPPPSNIRPMAPGANNNGAASVKE